MEDDIEWSVQQILQRGRINSVTHYLVKWRGYPLEQATWQPITNLDNCQEQIKRFESSSQIPKSKSTKRGKRRHFNMEKIFGKNLELAKPLEGQPLQENQAQIKFDQKQNQNKIKQPGSMFRNRRMQKVKKEEHFQKSSHGPDCTSKQENNLKLEYFNFSDSNTQTHHSPQLQHSEKQQLSHVTRKRLRSKVNIDLQENESLPHKKLKLSIYDVKQPIIQEQTVPKVPTKSIQSEVNKKQYKQKQNNQSITQNRSQNKENQIKLAQIKSIEKNAEINKQIEPNPCSNIQIIPTIETFGDQLQKNCKQSKKKSEQPIQDSKNEAQEVLISESSLFFQHLFNKRQILCNQFFKEIQSSNLIAAIKNEIQTKKQGKITILDLYDSPEILENAAPISIISDSEQDLKEPKALVRLQNGWRVIGNISTRLAIVSVQSLAEKSWLQICQMLELKK